MTKVTDADAQRFIGLVDQFEQDVNKSTVAFNGGETETYTSNNGVEVPSYRKWLKDKEGDIANAEADKIAAQQAALEAQQQAGLAAHSASDAAQSASDAEQSAQNVVGPAIQDSMRRAVERASGGKRTIIYDTFGNANVMNVYYKTTYENLGLSAIYGTGVVQAFKKDSGADFSEIFIGTFQSSGSQFVSEARAVPRVGINYDDAISGHKAKGVGWGTVSRWDWALLVHIMESLSFQPRGNTNYGRAHDAMWEWGQRQDGLLPGDTAGVGNVLTGTGPDTWTHDGSAHGIADMVGNVWEWVTGFKLQDGRVIIDPYNNQSAENTWLAQDAYISGPDIILDISVTAAADSNPWSSVTTAAGYVSNELLKRALIEPAGQVLNGRFYANNTGERLPLCGGSRIHTRNTGPAALHCGRTRTWAISDISSRSRFAV